MRAATIRRTALTATAVSFALLATACGDAEKTGEDGETKGAGAAQPAAKALRATELEKLVVAQGDIKGHDVTKLEKKDLFDPASLAVDRAACEPVARALSFLPTGDPAATAQRLVVHESEAAKKGMPSVEELGGMTPEEAEEATLDSLDLTKTWTSLWSYDAEGAEQALTALREAGEKCADGFTMTVDGTEQRVTEVGVEKLSVGQGAVAWTVGTKQDGTPAETKVAVFRQGTTLAGFSSFNIAAVTRGEAFGQPAAVIEAQAAKLG
ncbi:hypothetical protein E4198_19270 [Streptomyces sp. RKND-216]|uniref:hypothetical protein n=1 Tax=Streptomyces sp. RKND-216 TaxID=2562581 RepID=UPI00109E2F6C|nr:hypothetical protein [Streptomyces sp. RKND-216]THA26534.1 hypothetical protein E4198_19270 [Streptomyces sp. RKND-216]